MTPRCPGRVAVVTGAAGGIGRAVALGLARAGGRVTAADRDGERLRDLVRSAEAEDLDIRAVKLDVRDRKEVVGLFGAAERAGGVETMVHCAGVTARQSVLETDSDTWREVVEINLAGTLHCLQAAGRHMRDRGRGAIVVITSVNASWPLPSQAIYSACKAAASSLVGSLSVELGPAGVRVNAIAPGAIATGMNPDIELDRDLARRIPLLRIGQPEDLVGPVLFLLSDRAAYVTGATLVVDGGLLQTR